MKFATWNENKLKEAREILWINIEKAEVWDLDEIQTVDVEYLIKHKAKSAYDIVWEPVLVEDTWLHFEWWNSLPWALIKRFLDTNWIEWILKMLEGFENRKAKSICYVWYYDWKDYHMVSWECKWKIAKNIMWESWFWWDPIFIPNWYQKSFAQMTKEEKNAISHRWNAFRKLKELFNK